MNRLAIVALSLATTLTSVPPAEAFPTIVVPKVEAAPQAQLIDYHGGYRGRYYHHHHGGGWGWGLGGFAAGALIGGLLAQPNYYGPGYYDPGYYGPSYYGPGYYTPRYYYVPRYYRPAYYGGSAHVRWCYARYRSYRAFDDTFQPSYGPRRLCVSPY
ncbi:BA14K family protein [Rhizobium sp. CB3090]|uniref:BA14K family protein n=1 Tax=Rhizobium sp. CB3090 TaxID=3039156 RepID=UPI0024B1D473|nr:BA14K family protein [Rhizobium sp. CB3090]WFU08793.1 BA14K family protein [Rhizobium sp. CB3090]